MTRDELKEKLLALKADDIACPGSGRYRSNVDNKPCIVGALFEPEQLSRIIRGGHNGSGVATLVKRGFLPTQFQPLTQELMVLQNVFDNSNATRGVFIQNMKTIVESAFKELDDRVPL